MAVKGALRPTPKGLTAAWTCASLGVSRVASNLARRQLYRSFLPVIGFGGSESRPRKATLKVLIGPLCKAFCVSDVNFRRLSIADLDEAALRRLVGEGETLFVERKETDPEDGLGSAVASFANTLGGWLLLGVTDDGTAKGYDAGRGDFTDKVRNKLGHQVDPLPPFAADLKELDGVQIGVIRVFESADTPHIVVGDGSVPIREPGGMRRIQSHAELIELAKRGKEARCNSRERLHSLPYALEQIEATDPDRTRLDPRPQPRQFVVRAAPLTRPEGFADRLLSIDFGRIAREASRDLFPGPDPPTPSLRTSDATFGQRGFNFTTTQGGSAERASVIADAGGVLITRTEWPSAQSTSLWPEAVHASVLPLLETLANLFRNLDTQGRALCHLLVRGYSAVNFTHQRAGSGSLPNEDIEIGGEFTLPPDGDEFDTLVHQWVNELARSAGLEAWQDLPK